MKKSLYTIAFVALFSVFANAQDKKQVKANETPAPATKETVNPDGTLTPAKAEPSTAPANEAAPAQQQKGGTRMAITEKGVPASKKPAEPKKAEATKTEKH